MNNLNYFTIWTVLLSGGNFLQTFNVTLRILFILEWTVSFFENKLLKLFLFTQHLFLDFHVSWETIIHILFLCFRVTWICHHHNCFISRRLRNLKYEKTVRFLFQFRQIFNLIVWRSLFTFFEIIRVNKWNIHKFLILLFLSGLQIDYNICHSFFTFKIYLCFDSFIHFISIDYKNVSFERILRHLDMHHKIVLKSQTFVSTVITDNLLVLETME